MKKFLIALSLIACPLFGIGCDIDDEPDTLGESLEEAGDEMGDAAEEIGDEAEDAVDELN